jgi:hypothetical protein
LRTSRGEVRVAEVMPPAPPATKWAHALRSALGGGRGCADVGVMEDEDGLEDGSTWPSSRDWELGAAKADTVVGEMVVLIWERVGD